MNLKYRLRIGLALFCLTLLAGCATDGIDGGALIGALGQLSGGVAAGMGETGGNSAVAAQEYVRNIQHDNGRREAAKRQAFESDRVYNLAQQEEQSRDAEYRNYASARLQQAYDRNVARLQAAIAARKATAVQAFTELHSMEAGIYGPPLPKRMELNAYTLAIAKQVDDGVFVCSRL